MSELIEDQLATRLQTLGETVGDEVVPPADLELQVARRRRHGQRIRRGSALGVAAAIMAGVLTTVAVVHGSNGTGAIRIAASASTTSAPPTGAQPDALPAGTTMLSARQNAVVTLDANGLTNATMVDVSTKGALVTYARATADHDALWYRSTKPGPDACGEVVRADIGGRSSKIVTSAVAFDVSPDGSRLALYGAGDLVHDKCTPVTSAGGARVSVVDLTTGSSSSVAMTNVTNLRWSPDGSYVIALSCARPTCAPVQRIAVPTVLGTALVSRALPTATPLRAGRAEFGPGGLYVLVETSAAGTTTDLVERLDPLSSAPPVPIFAGRNTWRVAQVIPTSAAIYVVASRVQKARAGAAPAVGPVGLYRVIAGHLVLVRTLDRPGTFIPVTPLPMS